MSEWVQAAAEVDSGQDSSLTNYVEEKLDNILCWKCGRFVLN